MLTLNSNHPKYENHPKHNLHISGCYERNCKSVWLHIECDKYTLDLLCANKFASKLRR